MWLFTGALLCLSIAFNLADGQTNSERDLTDKIAVVTGAARGIGRAIAENLLTNGVKNVIIVDYNQTQGVATESTLRRQYGDEKVEYMFGDITKDLEQVHNDIYQKYGYVDILVNNAGILNEYDPELTLRTNVLGTVEWSLKFYNSMRKDRGGKGGTIINIASISGFMVDPFFPVYKSSKYAVIGLTIGLGHEYNFNKISAVRVLAVCPGLTNTTMTDGQMVVDEQAEVFSRFRANSKLQNPYIVGKNVVKVFHEGDTGSIWVSEDDKEAEIAPATRVITYSQLESL